MWHQNVNVADAGTKKKGRKNSVHIDFHVNRNVTLLFRVQPRIL